MNAPKLLISHTTLLARVPAERSFVEAALGSHPELFFQQAIDEPVYSPVSRAAQQRVGTKEESERWLEWPNRPREFVPPACLQVLMGHSGRGNSVAESPDGRVRQRSRRRAVARERPAYKKKAG